MRRRLAAVLMTDVVGYSRLMEADEAGTLAALRAHRETVLEPTVRAHDGRIVKLIGDGALIEFASALEAVTAAVALQRRAAGGGMETAGGHRIMLRAGINLGDVIEEGGDIYGEGVNIAARLEALAEPGGLCISAKVFDEVRGKTDAVFADMGEQPVKNIARPVRVYHWHPDGAAAGPPKARAALALPDKPSIAVLPFQNMSGDPDQEYFADGMVEEITTELSRLRWLFVIARNSSFTYKGRAVDVKQVGRDLGVRYVLEGSVRKAGSRVRIAGQLVDAANGVHLWADRFDGELADVFDLQDQVTARVVGAIGPRMEQAEIDRARRKAPESLDAYDHYLRGIAALHQWTQRANAEALASFHQAIALDPEFAAAWGMAARCYVQRKAAGWLDDPEASIAETERLARRAAELGKEDPVALCTAGFALLFIVGAFDDGLALTERALALNGNLAWALMFGGWARLWGGDTDIAMERVTRAMRLSPQDSQMFAMQTLVAAAHFFAGRDAEALSWAQAAVRERSRFLPAACLEAASAGRAGSAEERQAAITRLRAIDPDLRLSNLDRLLPLQQPRHMTYIADALRRAGLPE